MDEPSRPDDAPEGAGVGPDETAGPPAPGADESVPDASAGATEPDALTAEVGEIPTIELPAEPVASPAASAPDADGPPVWGAAPPPPPPPEGPALDPPAADAAAAAATATAGATAGGPTWAASAESGGSWGPPPPPKPRRGGGRLLQFVAAVAVGALVGAGVAAGVTLALDDDGVTREVVTERGPARATTEITEPGNLGQIIDTVEPAVVVIQASGEDLGAECGGLRPGGGIAQSAGTGFVVSPDGFVVTNSHVVAGADEIQVAFADGAEMDAELVARDGAADLAVLKVDGQDLPTVELGTSADVRRGDAVVAIGNALALEGGLSVTSGIIAGLNRNVPTECGNTLHDTIQTDAAINSGNSGGPLVDAQGRVIGINTAVADPGSSENTGFAIAIDTAKPIIDQLRTGEKPAFLGIGTLTVTPELAEQEDLGVDTGALVDNVVSGSPASEARIQEGDVVVKVGDHDVASDEDVANAVRSYRPGDTITVVVVRDGTEVPVEATLAERPDSS